MSTLTLNLTLTTSAKIVKSQRIDSVIIIMLIIYQMKTHCTFFAHESVYSNLCKKFMQELKLVICLHNYIWLICMYDGDVLQQLNRSCNQSVNRY